jgi:hypothetical protein
VAIDRGYIDYALFARWSMAGVFFVTRLKENAAFEVVKECEIPQNRNIRADQFIRLTGSQAQANYPDLLRRIVAWDAENEREIVLLTNLMEFGATTIAAIYKERWQIELFFESSTWCTPLDVMEFRGLIALNRPLVGSLDGSVQPRIAPRPLCAESRARLHKPATPATVSTESTAKQWSV